MYSYIIPTFKKRNIQFDNLSGCALIYPPALLRGGTAQILSKLWTLSLQCSSYGICMNNFLFWKEWRDVRLCFSFSPSYCCTRKADGHYSHGFLVVCWVAREVAREGDGQRFVAKKILGIYACMDRTRMVRPGQPFRARGSMRIKRCGAVYMQEHGRTA
jgi:hypothetical protein